MGTTGGRSRRDKAKVVVPLLSDWPAALTDSVIREAAREVDSSSSRVWHDFHARALAAGVADDLAALGREVMRESIVGDWSEDAKIECGLLDGGEAMIDFAIGDPLGAEQRWSRLLETGGDLARASHSG